MKLGANEKHVKTYEYFKSSHAGVGSMVVTDRRIIHSLTDKHGVRHSEVRIEDIRSVEASYRKKYSRTSGIIMMVLGVLLIAGGVVCAILFSHLAVLISSLVGIAVGILLFVLGLLRLLSKKQYVSMLITTDTHPGVGLDVYVTNRLAAKPVLEKKRDHKLHIHINEPAAREMIDEICAMVWELQSGNTDVEALVTEVDVRLPVPEKKGKKNKNKKNAEPAPVPVEEALAQEVEAPVEADPVEQTPAEVSAEESAEAPADALAEESNGQA